MRDETILQGFLTAVRQVSLAKREKGYSISQTVLPAPPKAGCG